MIGYCTGNLGGRCAAAAIGVAVCLVMSGMPAGAQAPQPAPPPPAVESTAPPPVPAPAAQPGLIDAFGRWMKDSTSALNARLGGGNAKDISDAASNAANNAAKNTADVAKGAADVTRDAASAVTNAARDTAGALSRLPTSRVAVGRERCAIAPNGAPDCGVAAQALCRAIGFASGSSIDFETAEACPSAALMARWRGEPASCTTENYVTRALCQ